MFQSLARAGKLCRFICVSVFISGFLVACGGGGSGGGTTPTPPVPPTPPAAPTVSLGFGIKQVQINWTATNGATYYRLWESSDGVAPLTQIGGDLTGTSATRPLALHLQVNARYLVQACNTGGCTDSTVVTVASQLTPTKLQQLVGYVKASNTERYDYFSSSVALSKDGSTDGNRCLR
jgi:hypothetical protein